MTAPHLPVFGDPALIVVAEHLAPGEVLAHLVDRPAFVAEAACRRPEHADVDWFPGKGKSARPAIAVCGSCPSLIPCRTWALGLDEPTAVGIFGGMTAAARRAARTTRRRAQGSA